MKKKITLSLLLLSLTFLGGQQVQAQNTAEETTVLKEVYQQMINQVMDAQLTDPEEANKVFSKLLRKVRNDKEQLVAVGSFFLNKNIYPCARQCAQQVYTLDPAYIPGLMLSGRVAMMRKDWGGAGQKFDEILNYQPENIEALRLNARVYKYVNPIVAKEMLAKIILLDKNDIGAYKELGDIAYHGEEYKDASEAYKSYFEKKMPIENTDLRAGENYLLSLMNQGDFITIKDNVDKFLSLDSNNLVVRRLKFFAQVETFDIQAQEGIKYLTEQQYHDSLFLYLDYVYASTFASEMLNDNETAIAYLKKAIEKAPEKSETYKKLANLLRANKQPLEAIEPYKKYIELLGDKADAAEKFGLALIYSAAKEAVTEPEARMQYILAGDKIFEEYMAYQPSNYLGPYYRAALWITNPQEAEVKPKEYYMKTIELLGEDVEGDSAKKSAKKRALQYLMIYTLKTNDDASCKAYVQQVLDLDPADQLAQKIKGILEK